jgi:hypothetical protein
VYDPNDLPLWASDSRVFDVTSWTTVIGTQQVTSQGAGVMGVSRDRYGVFGHSTNSTAIYGETDSTTSGAGVWGESKGNGDGVHGLSNGDGAGVWGESKGNGDGVHGQSDGTGAGTAGSAMGNGDGLRGVAYGSGAGVWGESKGNGDGVYGQSDGTGAAVEGNAKGNGNGVWGHSEKGEGVHGETKSDTFAAVTGWHLNTTSTNNVAGVWGHSEKGEGVHGETKSDTFAAVTGIQLNPNTNAAGIYGKGKVAGHFEGNVEVTGDILLLGASQDFAEDFDISAGGLNEIEPGTVMVLNEKGALEPSHQAYDTKVAGVISGACGLRPGIVLGRQESRSRRLPIALLGKVYCKVAATRSSIEIGDLLTTSQKKGHAMKADDPYKAFGTVIGKALGSIKEGIGIIPVLVALQ